MNRRRFTQTTGTAAAAAASLNLISAARGQNAPSNKLVVGIMGLGRGKGHIKGWRSVPGAEIAYVCDVDSERLAEGVAMVQREGQEQPAKGVTDFRQMLDDANVDVISVAAPNFWHAPATILACKAGKHVYVEKPGSYCPREAELMVEAARKYDRKVQMGNQRRSYPSMIEAMQKLHEGLIGKPLYARTVYGGARPSIKKGQAASPPAKLNYDLWTGPVPEAPYSETLVHYNWHWRWNYGGGEMANNGIHSLDIARWGLKAEYPKRVSFLANRYHYDDDWETPDTGVATYDFGDSGASWEQSSCHQRKPGKFPFITFACEGGYLEMDGAGGSFYDLTGTEVLKIAGKGGDAPHFNNLADAIRANVKLNSEIAEGQKSTLWCHLANIALRTNTVLEIDQATGKPVNNPAALKLWAREKYREGWEPTV